MVFCKSGLCHFTKPWGFAYANQSYDTTLLKVYSGGVEWYAAFFNDAVEYTKKRSLHLSASKMSRVQNLSGKQNGPSDHRPRKSVRVCPHLMQALLVAQGLAFQQCRFSQNSQRTNCCSMDDEFWWHFALFIKIFNSHLGWVLRRSSGGCGRTPSAQWSKWTVLPQWTFKEQEMTKSVNQGTGSIPVYSTTTAGIPPSVKLETHQAWKMYIAQTACGCNRSQLHVKCMQGQADSHVAVLLT